MSSMAQKDDFFFEANSVEDITEADYQRAMPYVEAAQAFAQTTYRRIIRSSFVDTPPRKFAKWVMTSI